MKSIKNIIICSLLLATSAFFSACDIDRFPYGSMADEEIKNDPLMHLESLLSGAYAQLARNWTDPMHRMGEYAGDNIKIRGHSTDHFFQFISFDRNPANSRTAQFWNTSYRAIAQASNIINMIETGQSATVDNSIGEAYFIRGMVYFYLVRAFGRPFWDNPDRPFGGVPIVNGTPDDVLNLDLPDRATVRETYQQIISDLNRAIELITIDRGNTFASVVAAQALLSRVYLFMSGTYENPNVQYAQLAIQYAQKVIDSDRHFLLPRDRFMRYPRYLPSQNQETIFALRRVAAEFSGWDHFFGFPGMYANIGGMGWGEMFASAYHLRMLDETGRNDWSKDNVLDFSGLVDARAAFIEPQWGVDERVFRFIRKIYNAAGVQTGYTFMQLPYTESGGVKTVTHIVRAATADVTEIVDVYTLTPIDAAQGIYSIDFINRRGGDAIETVISTSTITGVTDRRIRLNGGGVNPPEFYIVKSSREGEESHLHSPVISRLAEIYLNKAEAAVKVGNLPLALTALNTVRERSLPGRGRDMATFAANPGFYVDWERQLELAFQAERSFDVFRNGGTLTRRFPGGHNAMIEIPANDFRVTFFIPQEAIDAFAASGNRLTQNPTSN